MAVAVTPRGTTRWTQLSISSSGATLVLVPARPGAAIDRASGAWLAALDEASAVHVLPPLSLPAGCVFPLAPERASAYAETAGTTAEAPSSALTFLSSHAAVLGHVTQRGFELPLATSAALESLFASGWWVVAMETPERSGPSSTATLRVSDDGPPMLPLSLLGSRAATTRVTAFALGHGHAVASAYDLRGSVLTWGANGSSYVPWRRSIVERNAIGGWLRESAGHRPVFDGTVLVDAPRAPSVVDRYLGSSECISRAKSVASHAGALETTCAAGALGRIPGGTPCRAESGDIEAAHLTCGAGSDDLALALAGASPANVVLTRWAGSIPRGTLGRNMDVWIADAEHELPNVVVAGSAVPCASSSRPPLSPPSGGGAPRSAAPLAPAEDSAAADVASFGCSASTAVAEEEWDDGSDDCESDTSSGSDDCSGDTSSSSGSDSYDDYDDSYDDSDDSDDDADDDSSDDSDDDDGASDDVTDDTVYDLSRDPLKKKSTGLRSTSSRSGGKSPVSRFALFAVALLLPIRRLGRRN